MRPSKKAKKSHAGLHSDWDQRTQVEAQREDDFAEDIGDVQPSPGIQSESEVPCDEVVTVTETRRTYVRSHSPSSGKSFSSSTRPQTSLPDSDDDYGGGIADDAGERLSVEGKQLSGKPLHPEVLKGRNSGSRSSVCLNLAVRD